MCTWIVYCQLISMFYASKIMASLTIPRVYQPITSLQDVVDSGLQYTLFTDPVEETIWNKSSNPLRRSHLLLTTAAQRFLDSFELEFFNHLSKFHN